LRMSRLNFLGRRICEGLYKSIPVLVSLSLERFSI